MEIKKCSVCGKSSKDDAHFNYKRKLCNRHCLQLTKYGKFLDSECKINSARHRIPKEMLPDVINDYYGVSITTIHSTLKNNDIEIIVNSTHDCRFKAKYQDYDWCYHHFVELGMTHKEMADIAGCKVRTIEKWCVEKHKLKNRVRLDTVKFNNIQEQIILGSILGDGHINKKEDAPNFFISHAVNQKDYIFLEI